MATCATKERPILFSGRMVRAILDGQKTETRRPVKWKAINGDVRKWTFRGMDLGFYCTEVPSSGYVLRTRGHGGCWNDRTQPAHSPYGEPRDLLWVRERWRMSGNPQRQWVSYAAGGRMEVTREGDSEFYWRDGIQRYGVVKDRPSIHMPRWASRITLRVRESFIDRLCAITEQGAIAEGFPSEDQLDPRREFLGLWDELNEDRGFPARESPWVWVVRFEVENVNARSEMD